MFVSEIEMRDNASLRQYTGLNSLALSLARSPPMLCCFHPVQYIKAYFPYSALPQNS